MYHGKAVNGRRWISVLLYCGEPLSEVVEKYSIPKVIANRLDPSEWQNKYKLCRKEPRITDYETSGIPTEMAVLGRGEYIDRRTAPEDRQPVSTEHQQVVPRGIVDKGGQTVRCMPSNFHKYSYPTAPQDIGSQILAPILPNFQWMAPQ